MEARSTLGEPRRSMMVMTVMVVIVVAIRVVMTTVSPKETKGSTIAQSLPWLWLESVNLRISGSPVSCNWNLIYRVDVVLRVAPPVLSDNCSFSSTILVKITVISFVSVVIFLMLHFVLGPRCSQTIAVSPVQFKFLTKTCCFLIYRVEAALCVVPPVRPDNCMIYSTVLILI